MDALAVTVTVDALAVVVTVDPLAVTVTALVAVVVAVAYHNRILVFEAAQRNAKSNSGIFAAAMENKICEADFLCWSD